MSEQQVIFLEIPQVGYPAKILFQGRSGQTSTVRFVDVDGNNFHIQTKSGSLYGGPLSSPSSPPPLNHAHRPAETVASRLATTNPTMSNISNHNRKWLFIAAILVVLALFGALLSDQTSLGNPLPSTIQVEQVRLEHFRNNEGKDYQMIYVDWTNKSAHNVKAIWADFIFFNASKAVVDTEAMICIYSDTDGIPPGSNYKEPHGEGNIVLPGLEVTACEVTIVRVDTDLPF